MNEILTKGKKLFFSQQSSVLSAATVIMLMIVASRVLGLIRQRVLAYYFPADDLALFFAAFRIPDTIFEVLVFGTFSSAFIPVFTKSLKEGTSSAWKIASSVVNIGLIIYVIFAGFVMVFANYLYGVIAPGFGSGDREVIVSLVRVLMLAQTFFVVSYVLTGVLESLRHFVVPALSPLFYNLGIIVGTILFYNRFGLMAPALGVLLGAVMHFAIQLPFAMKLGFRFSLRIDFSNEVRKIGKLALPRIIEVSFTQVAKNVELYLASLISTASYTFFTFGNTLQLLPVGLFGVSIAKAALPTLVREVDDLVKFKKTLNEALNQMIFAVLPFAVALMVLRIPVVRLVYGTDIFTWEATVQTSMVLSAFAVSIVFQSAASLLARGFYAFHDTKTPVIVSIVSLLINIILDIILVCICHYPVWGLALAFSFGSLVQASSLYILLMRKIGGYNFTKDPVPLIKSFFSALASGATMYLFIKFFDRYAWVQKLSFLGKIDGGVAGIPFEKFVLDTRYTINLLMLTFIAAFAGILVYLGVAVLIKSNEVGSLFHLVKRALSKREVLIVPAREQESITSNPTDTV